MSITDNEIFIKYTGSEESFVMPESFTVVADEAFASNKTLKHVDLRNVRHIGARSFQDCSNLESVVMTNVDTIDAMAFEFCRSLYSIQTGDLVSVGEKAFMYCSKLDFARIPSTLRSVGAGAFSHTATKGADLHWLREIPPKLFSCCSSLAYADISGAVRIGTESFAGCTALSGVSFEAAEIIESNAFARCGSFVVSRLPNGLKELGNEAFWSVQNGLIIPRSVRSIGRDCLGPSDVHKSIRIYRSALFEFGNYFRSGRILPDDSDEYFHLWESCIDIAVMDDDTEELAGYLPLYSNLDPQLRSCVTEAFRPDNSFDYQVLDTVLFDGLSWNRRCMDRQAVTRLRYPFELSEDARTKYSDYIRRQLTRISHAAIADRNISMLEFLCEAGFINKDNILGLIDYSVSIHIPECTGFLLKMQAMTGRCKDTIFDEL